MNEKSKITLCYIGLFVLGLWAIAATISGGIGWARYNTATSELSEIRSAKPTDGIQLNLTKAETERDAALRQLDLANQRLDSLEQYRQRTVELVDRGIGLIRSARSTTGDIAGTVSQLRNNYNRLAEIIIGIAGNNSGVAGKSESGVGADASE